MTALSLRLTVLAFVSLACSASGQTMPADQGATIDLGGNWRFKLESPDVTRGASEKWRIVTATPELLPEPSEHFWAADYVEANGWHDLKVPANWETFGHSPVTYGQPDDAVGWYRHDFVVPAEWKGKLVKINFDGVQQGCEVWVNGQPANVNESSWGRPNYHESGYTAFQVDLTPSVKFGEKNTIALRVSKNSPSANLDTGDYQFLGGVYRLVTLYAVPATHVDDVTVRTKLLEDHQVDVSVIANLAASDGAPATGSVSARITDPKNTSVHFEVSSDGLSKGNRALSIRVRDAKLWSAEHPDLYDLTLELHDGDGHVIETVKQRIGLREIAIKDGIFLVNNTPVKFAGLCRHDLDPNLGAALGPDQWRRDILLAKAANFNAIRTSHYPYGKGFYEACDELGMYVADELPYCWTPTNQPAMQPAFDQRARETLRRDKNFASVVLWGIGNENKPIGENLRKVQSLVDQLDPTRPSVISQEESKGDNVHMTDSHYGSPADIRKFADAAARTHKPHIELENPNDWDIRLGPDAGAWDQWGQVMVRHWDVVWSTPEIPGSFLWEWADRATSDSGPTKLYGYDPKTNLGFFKIKGIVDAWRNPRPQFFHAKMAQSPIRIATDAKATVDGSTVRFAIENRYSFTDIAEGKVAWQLIQGGKPTAHGETKIVLAPLQTGTATLDVGEAAGSADALRVDFFDASGLNVVSHQFTLHEPTDEQIAANRNVGPLPEGLQFPELNFVTNETRGDNRVWHTIDRSRGRLVNVKINGQAVAGTESDATPYVPAARKEDAATAPATGRATQTKPRFAGTRIDRPLVDVRKLTADVVLDTAPLTIVAHVDADVAGNDFHYTFDWIGRPNVEVQELGWIFAMPRSFDHFSWDREALWTVYPDDHIGRPRGTATPESAVDASVLQWKRPDAFDFNSTKFDCNWATLTDAAGKGLRVTFAADDRHHVRGGWNGQTDPRLPFVFSTDGRGGSATTLDRWLADAFRGDPATASNYTLVVNHQVSPPNDLSTSSVADLTYKTETGKPIVGTFRIGSTVR